MAKNSPKNSAKKRQPSTDELPLRRTKKASTKNSKPRPKKPRALKKTAAKKSRGPVKQQAAVNKAATPKPGRNQKRLRQLNIWLGPGLRLELRFKLTKSTPKKRRKLSKKQQIVKLQRRRKISAIALMAAGFIGSIYFGLRIINPPSPPAVIYAPPTPARERRPEPIMPKGFTRSEPTNLLIPDIEVATSLISLGQKDDGTMEVPKSYEVAGWYRLGPTPGEIGPAVIVGHVDSFSGPAVFWRLSQLSPGQLIEVKRADGIAVQFKVDEVKQFDQSNFPSEEVYGDIDHVGLRVITCGGRFNYSTGNYSHNTVVYASLVI